MDILTTLGTKSVYSMPRLQIILGAWVLSTLIERRKRISTSNGHVSEEDYDKRSIYSLLYSLYRSVGVVRSKTGEPYEFTFNTWGYVWPLQWGQSPTRSTDPQRFGKNAYTGLFEFAPVKEYVRKHDGRVHVLEMGCGTGAGAHVRSRRHATCRNPHVYADVRAATGGAFGRKTRRLRADVRPGRRRRPRRRLRDARYRDSRPRDRGRRAVLSSGASCLEERGVHSLGKRHPGQHVAALLRLSRIDRHAIDRGARCHPVRHRRPR